MSKVKNSLFGYRAEKDHRSKRLDDTKRKTHSRRKNAENDVYDYGQGYFICSKPTYKYDVIIIVTEPTDRLCRFDYKKARYKKISNKKVRRHMGLSSHGNYKKVYDLWWEIF